MSGSLLLQLGPYAAVIATLLSIWRFAIKPKFDEAEAMAVETATWRKEVDIAWKTQKPLNDELIAIARWKISAENSILQNDKDVNKIMDSLADIQAMIEQGNKNNTEQHDKMREFFSAKIEKIKDDIYMPRRIN